MNHKDLQTVLDALTATKDAWHLQCLDKSIAIIKAELASPDATVKPEDDKEDSRCPTCGEDGGTSCGAPNCGFLIGDVPDMEQENAALRAGLAYYKQRAEMCEPTFQETPPAPVKPVEVYPFSNAGLA
jgi:hypothetical protein